MPRPKGHRLTEEQRKRCRPKHLNGGRKKGKQPDADRRRHKPTIRRSEPALTPDQKIGRKDALNNGHSIITAESLRNPIFHVVTPSGEIIVEWLEKMP